MMWDITWKDDGIVVFKQRWKWKGHFWKF